MLWHQDGHDIKAIFHFPNTKDFTINFCRPRDLPLFSCIDVGDHRRKLIRPACLDLDKTKRFAIQSDQIDLAGDLHALAVAADRNL